LSLTLRIANAKQQLLKKRHIGNDTINIIFQDGSEENPPASVDLSSFSSKFTYAFVVVRPVFVVEDDNSSDSSDESDDGAANGSRRKQKRLRFQISIACKEGVPRATPPLPEKPLDPDDESGRDFFLAKLIGVERAAQYAPAFEQRIEAARNICLQNILKEFPVVPPAGVRAFREKARRSTSMSNLDFKAVNPEDDAEDATTGIDLTNFERVGTRVSSFVDWPHEIPSVEVRIFTVLSFPCSR
jgi:Rap/ran-GAP